MSLIRLAVGVAAATAAAVMYANSRQRQSQDQSRIDRDDDDLSSNMSRSADSGDMGSSGEDLWRGPSTAGTTGGTMSGMGSDDLLSPSADAGPLGDSPFPSQRGGTGTGGSGTGSGGLGGV
jgi:hypothetical protein